MGGAVGLDHGDAVLLRDDGVAGSGGAPIWSQNEVRLLVGDQLLNEGGREVGVALIVLVLDLDGVLDVVDDDATAGLDPIEPQVVALLGEGAFLGLRACQGDRRAEDDGRRVGATGLGSIIVSCGARCCRSRLSPAAGKCSKVLSGIMSS